MLLKKLKGHSEIITNLTDPTKQIKSKCAQCLPEPHIVPVTQLVYQSPEGRFN